MTDFESCLLQIFDIVNYSNNLRLLTGWNHAIDNWNIG